MATSPLAERAAEIIADAHGLHSAVVITHAAEIIHRECLLSETAEVLKAIVTTSDVLSAIQGVPKSMTVEFARNLLAKLEGKA